MKYKFTTKSWLNFVVAGWCLGFAIWEFSMGKLSYGCVDISLFAGNLAIYLARNKKPNPIPGETLKSPEV